QRVGEKIRLCTGNDQNTTNAPATDYRISTGAAFKCVDFNLQAFTLFQVIPCLHTLKYSGRSCQCSTAQVRMILKSKGPGIISTRSCRKICRKKLLNDESRSSSGV